MIHVRRDDGASSGDLGAHELGGHVIGNGSAPGVAVEGRARGAPLAPQVLAHRNELHLRSDETSARIGELRHRRAPALAQRCAPPRKLRRAPRPAGEAVVERLHAPAGVRLDVAAGADPGRTGARQPARDVDGDSGIGVGAGSVVDRQRRLARGRMQVDLPHRNAQPRVEAAGLVDLARGRQGLGNDLHQLRIHRRLLAARKIR